MHTLCERKKCGAKRCKHQLSSYARLKLLREKRNAILGITTPKGFKATGMHCGLRRNASRKDLALIFCEKECNAAGVYTTNTVTGAPVKVTKEHLANGKARAIIANSANANSCAPNGIENAKKVCEVLADELGIDADDVIVASTGVIGVELNVQKIIDAVPELVSRLGPDGKHAAAHAIMTTDVAVKMADKRVEIDGKDVWISAIAKGNGMLHPKLATTLCFITTDCDINSELLREALRHCVKMSINRVTIDGDMSTNDMWTCLASGLAGNEPIIDESDKNYEIFRAALMEISVDIAKQVAKDGEGSTKLIVCQVKNMDTEENAALLAKTVVRSTLVKTAMFAEDANWGRVLAALGKGSVYFDPNKVNISFRGAYDEHKKVFDEIELCRNGYGLEFNEMEARSILSSHEVTIICDMNMGGAQGEAYGCDLTHDYIRITGDYRKKTSLLG